ncbi:MAG TPA: beta-galactosidase [Candidatus Acidoferrales bacterium]
MLRQTVSAVPVAAMILTLASASSSAGLQPAQSEREGASIWAPGDGSADLKVSATQAPPAASVSRGVQIVQTGGYTELRVDGRPFFVHSAAFYYYRIPDDLWERSLEAHRELGINTIDLYIPWNWHEPREGALDFEGRTHPRRNLRRLLRLITEKGFKLIARPGPVILNEWRHGGYPEWLLERPEYAMDPLDRVEGRYTPLSNLNSRDAEAAARGWLNNATHMTHARRWLAAVAGELTPYLPTRAIVVEQPTGRRGEMESTTVSGPLLFVQIDDDLAIGRSNNAGPVFWQYVQELYAALRGAGLDVPAYINPTDMRVSAAGSALTPQIGVMGQWYLQPPAAQDEALPAERRVGAHDASTIEFFAETLKTQPNFPAMIIEYQAGWYTPGDDARPLASPPENTLISSRLLVAHGIQGVNYFPAQDTITPAGYETPWTNRHYRWDAALDAAAQRQFRSIALERNAQLLARWGQQIAASHKRADLGLVYPLGAYQQEPLAREDVFRVSGTVLRLARAAWLADLSVEFIDPHYQPVEHLMRHAAVLLPVVDGGNGKFRLSEKAQRALVEYVRRGGTLVVFPARPAEPLLAPLFAGTPEGGHGDSAVTSAWTFGQGRVLESTKDFYSWISWTESLAANRARFEADFAARAMREFLTRAGAHAAVKRELKERHTGEVLATQLVTNEGSRPFGDRSGGRGLLSVTNLSPHEPAEETLHVLSPRVGARPAPADLSFAATNYTVLPVTVPPAESLLLPIHQPLCDAATPRDRCTDEVVIAGAEMLNAERDGRTLLLTFYAPARATVVLHIRQQPRRVELDEMRPEAEWVVEKNHLVITVPRGAAPHYLRTVKVHMRYQPMVREKVDPSKLPRRRDFDWSVFDALRLPLAEDMSLPSYPPLVVLNHEREGQLLVQATNFDDMGRDFDLNITGAVRGGANFGADGKETRQVAVRVRASRDAATESNGPPAAAAILESEITMRAGRDRRSTPIYFVAIPEEGAAHYEHDFDRDGAAEYVIESTTLRLIAAPASGGRAVALVDKLYNINLFTNVGGLRDHFAFTPNAEGVRPDRARGRYGLFNRSYQAEWVEEIYQEPPPEPGEEKSEAPTAHAAAQAPVKTTEKTTALKLSYTAADVFPAGASIEKVLRLVGNDTLEAAYRVALAPRPSPAAENEPPQAFWAVSSVPVMLRDDRTTRFCWRKAPSAAASEAAPGEESGEEEQCETFVPGRVVDLPSHVRRMEIRTPGRVRLALTWNAGRLVIDMKNFSALLKVQFPALTPGGDAGDYRLRWRVLPLD